MESHEQDNLSNWQGICTTRSGYDTEYKPCSKMQDLPFSDDFSITRVSTCGGRVFCPRGKQDSLDLGLKLEERLYKIYLSGRLYIAVSGCDNHCADASVKDIGIVGTSKGWDVFVGDQRSKESTPSSLLASDLSTQQVLEVIDKVVVFFRTNYKSKKRLWALIKGIGFESFKAKVFNQDKFGSR